MLLLKLQIGAVLELVIYVLNLYNVPINSYYSGKAAELLMKNRSLISN